MVAIEGWCICLSVVGRGRLETFSNENGLDMGATIVYYDYPINIHTQYLDHSLLNM